MGTAYNDIRAAIDARINTNWTSTPIAWQNTNYNPDGVAAFIRPAILWAESHRENMTGVSTSGQMISGILEIQIFTREGTGIGIAHTYADSIAALFNEVRVTVGSADRGLAFETPEPITIGDDGNGFYQINVRCPFSHIT